MPGLEANIFKEQYQQDGSKYYIETETNEIGVLYLRGASVMQRYCDTKAKGGTEIISGEYRDDNWLNTGDLFLRDEEGYFYFKVRSKDLIKQGGYCIYPRDIEDHVLKHPNVYLCSVLGQFDQQENQIAHIFINLQEDSKERRDELRKWLSEEIDSIFTSKKNNIFL
ncbi:long-chain-fatty-acid--CoA ligase-like [Hydra vulgaris]|uniref:Long-chain-fatty-acid--CoA ligase-like n=1 Tax=Hydra vulgaris TaxID=6087 RepID=A0ABM4DLY5_HYDVU